MCATVALRGMLENFSKKDVHHSFLAVKAGCTKNEHTTSASQFAYRAWGLGSKYKQHVCDSFPSVPVVCLCRLRARSLNDQYVCDSFLTVQGGVCVLEVRRSNMWATVP